MMGMVMGERGRRPARPAAASRPRAREVTTPTATITSGETLSYHAGTQAGSKKAEHKRVTTSTATITSGETLSDHDAQEGQEAGPPLLPTKVGSVSNNLTAEQEQQLVNFFAVNTVFYDQTHKQFKDRQKNPT